MKTSMTPAAVHKQYTEGISAFQRHISGPDVRLGVAREADEFFRRCALGVWQADGAPITPVHVEYYGAIYTQGNQVPTELFWELSTMVSEYDGFTPPAFFKKMVDNALFIFLNIENINSVQRSFIRILSAAFRKKSGGIENDIKTFFRFCAGNNFCFKLGFISIFIEDASCCFQKENLL